MYYRSISGMANFNKSFKIFASKLPIKNFHGRYMTIEQTFCNTQRVRSRGGADDGRRADWELCQLSAKTVLQS